MKLSTTQEQLSKGLTTVSRSVAHNSSLPVLANVLLATTPAGELQLSANNLDTGTTCTVPADTITPGAVSVPARLFTQLIQSLPTERVDLTLDETTCTLNIRCAHFEANLMGIDAEEFPRVMAPAADTPAARIDPEVLKEAIERTVFAAATDESRPVLTGVQAAFAGDTLTLRASDGFRLSVQSVRLTAPIPEDADIIIPAKALSDLARILGGRETPVQVMIANRQILFRLDDVDLVSQLVDGKFPDVAQIIPTVYDTCTRVDTKALLKAARFSHLFARESANIIELSISERQMVLRSAGADLGDNETTLEAESAGDAIEIAFNAKYLIQMLAALGSEAVSIETTKASRPAVLRTASDDNFLHVLMPMHVKGNEGQVDEADEADAPADGTRVEEVPAEEPATVDPETEHEEAIAEAVIEEKPAPKRRKSRKQAAKKVEEPAEVEEVAEVAVPA